MEEKYEPSVGDYLYFGQVDSEKKPYVVIDIKPDIIAIQACDICGLNSEGIQIKKSVDGEICLLQWNNHYNAWI